MSLVAYDSSDNSDNDDEVTVPEPTSTKSFVNNGPILPKKDNERVKISIPSLSDFKDVDEEMETKKTKLQASKRGTGLFSLLPPPRGAKTLANFVPHVLKKPAPSTTSTKQLRIPAKTEEKSQVNAVKKMTHALSSLKYDSNSEDEDEQGQDKSSTSTPSSGLDFFSLTKPVNVPITPEIIAANLYTPPVETATSSSTLVVDNNDNSDKNTDQIFRSTVMNLSRDEIMMKNKADVGPKLPVPEQEYHVDAEGNVAFDEKAIEYLCGKRGVKRKAELINATSIIDINGEDMKPDEREWLVKALTENPVQRPVTIGSGPGGQSKKKHQITYLAHQAKAMELELQNQWASNRVAKNQAKSKYGF